MNESLQRWRDEFARDPAPAFDRLARGLVPLGAAAQLSLGEILDQLFAPGDADLDQAVGGWLEKYLLSRLPEDTSLNRWVFILQELFQGLALMELPKTGELLRTRHKRFRLWLHGFHDGPSRDPEGAYLLALARAQENQQFAPLWRRLILGEELAERAYLAIGILGFRKMPGEDGRNAAEIPEGLLQALVTLADTPGTVKNKWQQTMRSLFAAYRLSAKSGIGYLAPLLANENKKPRACEWLEEILPGIGKWRGHEQGSGRQINPVPIHVSIDWVRRVKKSPDLCDAPEFFAFLNQHRAYAQTTGDPEFINKTFNNLSQAIIKADPKRAPLAVTLIEEALTWAPEDPRNWTSHAIVLHAAQRPDDAIAALWEARQRFAWYPFIRNELGRILRMNGDLIAAAGVYREAAGHFPSDVVCRTGLAETLKAMEQFDKAREVFEQACRDFPDNVVCRNGLGDLLIDLAKEDEAERVYRQSLQIDPSHPYARGGLARAWAIQSAKTNDVLLKEKARDILKELAGEGNRDALRRLPDFDSLWERAKTDPAIKFRGEKDTRPQPATPIQQPDPGMAGMRVAERLGRAMLTLWQAEHAENAILKSSFCAHASALLDLAEEQIDGDLLAAFVETRGLILLASGDTQKALAYFEEQSRCYGRGGWIGIRLGTQRARLLLGESIATDNEPPVSQSAWFAFHVVQVIQTLATSPREDEVRELLESFYPKAAELAARVKTNAKDNLAIDNGMEMLGLFVQSNWFRPAGITALADMARPGVLAALLARIRNSQTDTFAVLANATLTLA